MGKDSEFEKAISCDPNSLELRDQAIRYYHEKKSSIFDSFASIIRGSKISKQNLNKRCHILWIIENAPESIFAVKEHFQISPIIDKEGFEIAERLWAKHLKEQPSNKVLIRAAGHFFISNKPEKALEIYIDAEDFDTNMEWRSSANYARWLLTGLRSDELQWSISFWKWKFDQAPNQTAKENAKAKILEYQNEFSIWETNQRTR